MGSRVLGADARECPGLIDVVLTLAAAALSSGCDTASGGISPNACLARDAHVAVWWERDAECEEIYGEPWEERYGKVGTRWYVCCRPNPCTAADRELWPSGRARCSNTECISPAVPLGFACTDPLATCCGYRDRDASPDGRDLDAAVDDAASSADATVPADGGADGPDA